MQHKQQVLCGNIEAECNFNPDLIEKGTGVGYGLVQWSYGRRKQYESYAKSKGSKPSDVNTQVEFLLGEMTPGGGANGHADYQFTRYNGYSPEDFKNAKTPEDAAIAFCWTFERPNSKYAHVSRRQNSARKYYDQFNGTEVASAAVNSSSTEDVSSSAKNTASTSTATVTTTNIKDNDSDDIDKS